MKHPLLIILFSLIFFLPISSCKKSIENKIEGTWRRVNIADINSSEFDEWRFNSGYIYVVHYKATSAYMDTLSYSYGEYVVKNVFFKRILSITKSTDADLVGNWRIDKLNRKYLNIYPDKAYLEYLEFTKK